MKQEEKDLLLKDLCARLPYGVKVLYKNKVFSVDYISAIYEEIKLDIPDNYTIDISEIKPYLFPLSSMTEEQKSYLHNYTNFEINLFGDLVVKVFDEDDDYISTDISDCMSFINWLIKNKFDIYGLIPKGLAIDATNLNIY